MLGRAGIAALVSACSYTPPANLTDADPLPDIPVDIPIDMPVSQRVQNGLVGFWTFNEASGPMFANDTASAGSPVMLKVETSGVVSPPTFAGGTVTATTPARLISTGNNHLPADCAGNGGVTLEVWLRPGAITQGSLAQPKFVTGLAASITLRDVVLLHAGDKWLGRVRTTAALDGTPNLLSTTSPSNVDMQHVVIVADATQRKLYVDNVPEADDAAPAALTGWDTTYAMAMFDEPAGGRQWLGSVAMIALYNRALDPAEVKQNFDLGPDAP